MNNYNEIIKDINEELDLLENIPHELDMKAWELMYYKYRALGLWNQVQAAHVGTDDWVNAGDRAFNEYTHKPNTVKFKLDLSKSIRYKRNKNADGIRGAIQRAAELTKRMHDQKKAKEPKDEPTINE